MVMPTKWTVLDGSLAAGDVALAEGKMLVGNSSGVAAALDMGATAGNIAVDNGTTAVSVAVSGDATLASSGALTVTDVTVGSDAAGDMLYKSSATALTRLAKGTTGQIITSNGSVPAWGTMSGDATIVSGGALTIANDAVNEVKVADGAGVSALHVAKYAYALYDFSTDGGGAPGAITLTSAVTIPDNACVTLDSYDVLTTCTSAGDTGTLKVGLVTDGDLSTAIAINDGTNPWDAGMHFGSAATPLAVKTTGARLVTVTTATQAFTAGKIIFCFRYYVTV